MQQPFIFDDIIHLTSYYRYQNMSFFKSDKVSHFQIILPRQNSYRVVAQIGRLGIVQFKQQSLNHQDMPYTSQVKLSEQYLQNIKTIQRELYQQGRGLPEHYYQQEDYNVFLETYDRRYRMSDHSHLHLLEKIVGDLQKAWKNRELLKQRKSYLLKQQQDLIEQRCILQITKKVFGSIERNSQFNQERFKLGIVLKKDQYSFKRTIFRMSKGLSLLETLNEESEALNNDNSEKKVAFYVYYGFFTGNVLQSKLRKLFQTYNVKQFNHTMNQERINQRLEQLQRLLVQNKKLQQLVEQQFKIMYQRLLEMIPSEHQFKMTNLQYYKLYLLHQKIIYSILNAMKVQHSFIQAELYVPTYMVQTLTNKLQFTLLEDKMPIPQLIPIFSSKKPTLFATNSFTDTQYQVLSAYGVPHYQEVNPAFFNALTFPFLFGVMFGDIGHGLILLGFALILVLYPKLFQNKLIQVLVKHKWSLLLMGFFSTYCGLIYNEYFSISLSLFRSCYKIGEVSATLKDQCVYPIGIDPIWSISENQLQFTNSLKMKISVIIAVVHMTLGLVLKTVNQINSKKYLFVLMETIPQLIFFILFFGYMDFLIIYKWTHEWTSQTAPSIITTMMNIPLQLGKTENCCGGQPMWGDFQTTSQNSIQLFILVIMLICIPMILCLKPLYLYLKQKKKVIIQQHLDLEYQLKEIRQQQKMIIKNNLLEEEEEKEQQLSIGQIIVHQIIQTIQFILGTISNTASYLRLWALSLAHSSLSDVFFQQTVQKGLILGYGGIPLNLILFPIFAGITFGILLCMDTLQCFLHSLRLHWVQFQNKFYKGDGKQFQTLNFRDYTNNWLQINQII